MGVVRGEDAVVEDGGVDGGRRVGYGDPVLGGFQGIWRGESVAHVGGYQRAVGGQGDGGGIGGYVRPDEDLGRDDDWKGDGGGRIGDGDGERLRWWKG